MEMVLKVLFGELGGRSTEETSGYGFEIRIANLRFFTESEGRLVGRKVEGRRQRRRGGSSPEKILELGGENGEIRRIRVVE